MIKLLKNNKYYNIFLNWIIPNRRSRLLQKMMKQDQELGLYDCCRNYDELGKCKCKN